MKIQAQPNYIRDLEDAIKAYLTIVESLKNFARINIKNKHWEIYSDGGYHLQITKVMPHCKVGSFYGWNTLKTKSALEIYQNL